MAKAAQVAVDSREPSPKLETVENPFGLYPTEFKVLILPDAVEEKTSGGILIPETTKERREHAQVLGRIVAQSPAAFSYHDWGKAARIPEVGDRVYYAKYAGDFVKGKDGKQYRVVNDRDISLIVDF